MAESRSIHSFFLTAPNQHRPLWDLRREPDDIGLFPLPGALSHIHSKTACRGFKSFCPCQKSQVSLLRYLTFSLVCGRIWQRGAPAGPPAVRVVGRWSPVATVQRRPRRQPRPSPSLDFLLAFRVFSPGFIRLQPLHPSPAPKTHPVSPFLAFSGCVFSIFAVFRVQNFRACFCASCRIVVTS